MIDNLPPEVIGNRTDENKKEDDLNLENDFAMNWVALQECLENIRDPDISKDDDVIEDLVNPRILETKMANLREN